MVQSQRLNTDDFPPTQRLSRCTQFISEIYAISSLKPVDPVGFCAQMSRVEVGRIGFSWLDMTPSTVEMDGGQLGSWTTPVGSDVFLLAVQESGQCTGNHLGRQFTSRPGDMMLLDPVPLPWKFAWEGMLSTTTIKLPAERLLALVGDAERLCGVAMDGSLPHVALGASLIHSIRNAFQRDFEEMSKPHYEDLLFSVIATILGGGTHSDAAPKSTSLRRLAGAVVERHMSDPDLDVGMIATALGISTRTIQRMFLEIGYTPRGYILDRRITTAAERLRYSERHTSITDIAYSLGFNDLSNFTRSFTRKMGMSPRAYRSGH